MKRFISIMAVILCLCTVLTACGKPKSASGDVYNPPKNLMTLDQYHAELDKLLNATNFSNADTGAIDKLGDRLAEMIKYNTDDITDVKGTTYYVAKNGDDKNDGKTPETAWATLDKVNSAPLNPGDAVLFNRGDGWRGYLFAKNGITYGAYGKGLKPVISYSMDVKNGGKWEETDTENVWKFSERITAEDTGVLLFNNAEDYADLRELDDLKDNNQFAFSGQRAQRGKKDNYLYLYCDKGNPAEVYDSMEVTLAGKSVVYMLNNTHDVTLNNLKLCGGNDTFFASNLTNIKISYCQNFWSGGNRDTYGTRLGGGSGAWFSCDGIYIENCHIYQQFDAGISPQYSGSNEAVSVFKDFVAKNCLFEYCEYTFEYFDNQSNSLEERYENFYFGYNFCRLGGYGFGDKPSNSRYIKSWGTGSACVDCVIENNVFDRAATTSIEIVGKKQTAEGNVFDINYMPKLKNNIYIHQKNKRFATIQDTTYKFNEETYNTLINMGVDEGARYFYAENK